MPLYQAQFSKATLYTKAGANSFVVTLNVSMVWITTIGGGGTVNVAAWALTAGAEGNLSVGASLELVTPSSGLTGAVVVSMVGGLASEPDADLRVRLLEVMRNAPAGGNAADYKRWALEVPGVSRAFVFGNRAGLGSVDVAIMTPTGLPSGGLITQVEAYIADRRPVTAAVLVLQPDLVDVDVTATITLAGTTLPVAQAAAQAALTAYIDSLQPGDTVYRSKLIAAIQDVDGVVAVNIGTMLPAADVPTTVSALVLQLAALGTLTLSL